MKKLLALLLALCMVLSLAACGSSNEAAVAENTSADEAAAAENTSADEAAAPAADAGITTINPGKLTISTSPDFPPYEMTDDSGAIIGIEPELFELIAQKLGLELQIDAMDFDSALMAVQQGKSDAVVSGVTVTEDRKLVMDFSDSYTTAVQVVVVPEGSDVTLDNLGEQSIGVQRGTTGQIFTEDDFGEDHVVAYDTYSSVVQALLNGQIDCIVMDNGPAKAYVEANPGLSILDTEYVTENYAFGITKGNTALLDGINQALKELTEDGTVQSILDKYISE